ncbi:hypothetical protein HY407_00055, partial [Candidatus Gottesmanbacteria bacterium]|nr:hypothetical protein [Candidatus Gottesmanbacteria bacterium]
NWKTYTNTKYGISFNYPSNYLITENQTETQNEIYLSASEKEKIGVEKCLKQPECHIVPFIVTFKKISNPEKISLSDYVQKNANYGKYQPITVDNHAGLQLQLLNEFYESLLKHTYIQKEDSILYIFTQTISDSDMKLFDQILSTFKFIEISPTRSKNSQGNTYSQSLQLSPTPSISPPTTTTQECSLCGPQGIHNVKGNTCPSGLICKSGEKTSLSYCVKENESTAKCEN